MDFFLKWKVVLVETTTYAQFHLDEARGWLPMLDYQTPWDYSPNVTNVGADPTFLYKIPFPQFTQTDALLVVVSHGGDGGGRGGGRGGRQMEVRSGSQSRRRKTWAHTMREEEDEEAPLIGWREG